MSDDFINEAKKMAREKQSGDISLKLLISIKLRKRDLEEIIIKNLHTHFRRLASQLKNEVRHTQRRGLLLSILGVIIIIAASSLTYLHNNFLINTLRIVMEPAGWFLTWTGLDNLFYSSRSKKPEFDFASRMAHAEITFISF